RCGTGEVRWRFGRRGCPQRAGLSRCAGLAHRIADRRGQLSTVAEGASGPAVVLIGPPGAGKTSVAAALGKRMSWAVRDTDEDVEAVAGRSVSAIFTESGEAEFRRLERAAVARAVTEH